MNNKNGRKTFLNIHLQKSLSQKLLRRIIAVMLLFVILSLNTIQVFATTLEEIESDNSQSSLNIEDDDFGNGNLLFSSSLYGNGMTFLKQLNSSTVFTNGMSLVETFTFSSSLNGSIDLSKKFRERINFQLADKTKMFSEGSTLTVSISNWVNQIYIYDNAESEVINKGFDASAIGSVEVILLDVNGSYVSLTVPNVEKSSNNNRINLSFSFSQVPFDVYAMYVQFLYDANIAYGLNGNYLGDSNYSFTLDAGFLNGKVSFVEEEYSLSDELLGAINDNLNDIYTRLCKIYDMVEEGFSAIVTLFYDLMDFLADEFDDLSQTIVTQAGETRHTIVTQFTNITTNLRTWFNDLTSTLNTNFQNLLNQNEEEHEEVINGYDDTVGSDRNDEVQSSINDYNSSQGEIMDDMNENMDDFTLPSDGLIGYAVQFVTTFPLVASMMQSVFDSSGQFGIIIAVVFCMTIFAMVAGMYKYYKD